MVWGHLFWREVTHPLICLGQGQATELLLRMANTFRPWWHITSRQKILADKGSSHSATQSAGWSFQGRYNTMVDNPALIVRP